MQCFLGVEVTYYKDFLDLKIWFWLLRHPSTFKDLNTITKGF
jgi:hypothetical protein